MIVESSQNFFLYVIPETIVVLFTYYQKQFNGKSLRQNIFPMQNALDRSYRSPLKFLYQMSLFYFKNLYHTDSEAHLLFNK